MGWYAALAAWSAFAIFYETLEQNDATMKETKPAIAAHAILAGILNAALGALVAQIHPSLVGGSSIAVFMIATRTGRFTVKNVTRRIQQGVRDGRFTETEWQHSQRGASAD